MVKQFFEDKKNKVKEGYTDIAMDEVSVYIAKYKDQASEIDKIILNIEKRILSNLSEYQSVTKQESTGVLQIEDSRLIKNRINYSFLETLNELNSNISFCDFLEKKKKKRTILYVVLAVLFLCFLILSIFALYKLKHQNPDVIHQNTENAPTNVEVFSLNRILNLIDWQFVSKNQEKVKISKAVFTDIYRLRKNNSVEKEFLIKHATTGKISPDFIIPDKYSWRIDSISNSKPVNGSEPSVKVYDIYISLENIPVNTYEDIEIKTTYWNAFNNDSIAWTAIPVLYKTNALTYKIYFPKGKPFNNFQRESSPRGAKTPIDEKLVNTPDYKVSEDRRFIEWNITNARKNWVYAIRWNW